MPARPLVLRRRRLKASSRWAALLADDLDVGRQAEEPKAIGRGVMRVAV
jgi:hypothetical protein